LSLSGCAAAVPQPAAPAVEDAAAPVAADPLADLIAAAQAEGELTTIALPRDWCNYGEMIDTFSAKYGMQGQRANPTPAPATSWKRSRPTRTTRVPQAPDVIDVGFAFGPQAKEEGLIQPYKVSTWDTIPDRRQGPRWLLVRRLLWRYGFHGQQGRGRQQPADLGSTC
jgi:putative spermidine/putrescine transport system substrate-binding protein